MKAKKIMATLVVTLMVLSTLVVLNQLNINLVQKASAQPGVDEWGYGNPNAQVWTKDLKYDPNNAVNIIIDTNGLAAQPYYLYYPQYHRSGITYNMTWKPYLVSGVQKYITVTTPGTNVTLTSVYLNKTGIWVLNPTQLTADIDGDNWAATAPRWFWVNSSQTFSLSTSPNQVFYGNNQTIDLTVSGASGNVWFSVRRQLNGQSIAVPYAANYSFSSDWKSTLQWAGNYTVIAYQHVDFNNQPAYDPTTGGWTQAFGSTFVVPNYNYNNNGPWDPPAYNSSLQTLYVQPGQLSTSIPAGNQTMYWGFQGEVNVSVKDYNDQNLTAYTPLQVVVQGPDTNGEIQTLTPQLNIHNHYQQGYVTIESGSWGVNGPVVYGVNGTWTIFLWSDRDGDSLTQGSAWADEWNTSVDFTVTSAPGMQWRWISDDGGIGKPNDGVIPFVPDIAQQPLNIEFKILGESANQHYGDQAAVPADTVADYGGNITISGDALYTDTLDNIPGVTFNAGTWTVPLTPLMALNGGTITFEATWEDHGSLTETLTVGGSQLNGSIVTISPTKFTFGQNTTFTVTVKTGAGLSAYNAQVWLYWVDDDGVLIPGPAGVLSYKNGGGTASGEYTFFVNKTMQKDNQTAAFGSIMAPRDIAAYVQLYEGSPQPYVYGYALTTMKGQSNLKVTWEPGLMMAGQKIAKIWVNTTIVDSTGNKTGRPDSTGLHVRLYNSTGDDVTDLVGNIASADLDGARYINLTNKFLQKIGTYTVSAYNDTCDSYGHNGTIDVKPVDVTCDLSELIWHVDDNVTATFTVNYNGLPVNGTLILDNITHNTSWNGTWYLGNNTPMIGGTGLTIPPGMNTSIQITVTNGVGIVHNITASSLFPSDVSKQNITYLFRSKTPGSAWAHTNGILPVKIANIAVTPSAVVLSEASDITVTVSGRGTGLANVFVSLGGATEAQNGTTGTDGTITFSVVPTKSGKITIAVENRTSDTYVLVTNWKLYIDPISQVNEEASFTVMVRNGTATGAALAGVQVIAGTQTGTTDASGQASFTAPQVGRNGATLTITASKAGYAPATVTTIVNNVPRLIIIPAADVKGKQKFSITVANDDGAGVAGASVTFNGNTVLSGANGETQFTAPDVTSDAGADYQITATFTGYADATPVTQHVAKTPGVPGFELLTLVVALGVAFLLLRRRQK